MDNKHQNTLETAKRLALRTLRFLGKDFFYQDSISKNSNSLSAYDANGNILKYLRHGANQSGRPLEMDGLNYKYNRDVHGRLVNNKLNYVTDQVNAEAYLPDIDNEKPDNYRYNPATFSYTWIFPIN